MRKANAAEAAADKLRNERRDAEGSLKSLSLGAITHLVAAILPQRSSARPAVLPESPVGQVLGKRLPVIAFAHQHLAKLASSVHFVDAPRCVAAVIDEHQQHF